MTARSHLDANARLVAHGHSMIPPGTGRRPLTVKVTYFEPSGLLDGPHSPESARFLVSRGDTVARGAALSSRRHLAQRARLGAAAG